MDALEARGRLRHGLFPRRFAEVLVHLFATYLQVGVLADAVAADQRLGESVGVVNVVEAEAALDAQTVLVGRSIATVNIEQLVVLDMHPGLAADAAIGTE